MTTVTVTANDSASAMEELVEKLGADAYILGTKKIGSQIEVRATNEPIKKNVKKPVVSNSFNKLIDKQLSIANNQASGTRKAAEVLATPGDNRYLLNENFEINVKEMRNEFGSLKKMLYGMIVTETDGLNENLGKSTRVRLLQAGFSPDLITRLCESFEGKAYEMGRVNFLRSLAKKLSVEDPVDLLDRANIIFVVGGVGSGKTTLSAKLAAYLKERNSDGRMALANFEKTKSSTGELLKSFSRLTNIPNFTLTDDDIEKKLALIDQKVVIDVSYDHQTAVTALAKVRNSLGATNVLTVVATSVGSNSNAISKELSLFESLNPIVGLTKFDMYEMSARELSVIAERNHQIGFFTGTKSIINGISVMKEDTLAQYLKERY